MILNLLYIDLIVSNNKKNIKTNEQFIVEAEKIHNKIYDYFKTNYSNSKKKVCIRCPTHGDFWQTPNSHLSGQGCSLCCMSHGEAFIKEWLLENDIKYVFQYKFNNLRSYVGHFYRFDFYIPSKNLLIEFDGEQHFRPVTFNGISKERAVILFEKSKQRDSIKNSYCEKNGIPLLRISYKEFSRIPELLNENILKR